jgi:hypothetical protein
MHVQLGLRTASKPCCGLEDILQSCHATHNTLGVKAAAVLQGAPPAAGRVLIRPEVRESGPIPHFDARRCARGQQLIPHLQPASMLGIVGRPSASLARHRCDHLLQSYWHDLMACSLACC